METGVVVVICLLVVAFFVWVIYLCVTSVDKKESGSNINPDLRSYVVLEDFFNSFLRQLKLLFISNSKEGFSDSLLSTLLRKNWKTLLFIGAVLFAWFIWPTPYKQLPLVKGVVPQRENRFSKQVERWDLTEKRWK
jgi:hypothetical protein